MGSEMMRQSDVKIEEQLETVNKLKNQNRSLKNEIPDLRVEMESTAAGLEKEKWNNGMKDSTIEELNEDLRRLTEEKKEMKIESDKSIEALELFKKAAEDEYLSEQEVAKEAMRKLEEAMSLKEEQHLSSTETSKELLESMEGNLSAREEELNDLKRKCVEKEAKLEEMEREIVVLSKEKKNIEIEMEERVKAMSR